MNDFNDGILNDFNDAFNDDIVNAFNDRSLPGGMITGSKKPEQLK